MAKSVSYAVSRNTYQIPRADIGLVFLQKVKDFQHVQYLFCNKNKVNLCIDIDL